MNYKDWFNEAEPKQGGRSASTTQEDMVNDLIGYRYVFIHRDDADKFIPKLIHGLRARHGQVTMNCHMMSSENVNDPRIRLSIDPPKFTKKNKTGGVDK